MSWRPLHNSHTLERTTNALGWVSIRILSVIWTLIKFPGVLQALAFTLLYLYAWRKWFEQYNVVWAPAFPKTWTVWVMVLTVIPAVALLQLLWLLGWELVVWLLHRRYGLKSWNRGKYDRPMYNGESQQEEYTLLAQIEEAEGPQSPTQRSAPTLPRRILSYVPSVRAILWWAQIILCTVIVFQGYKGWTYYENEEDIRWKSPLQRALAQRPVSRAGYAKGEKIFIGAMFSNNEEVLPYWTKSVLDTITYLGLDNVAISILENNSNDRTPEILREFDEQLGKLNVTRRILIQDDVVKKPEDMAWNGRIEFLAALRNRVMEPLIETGGYDKVVFSNDVFIEPETLIELIETADGNYDMACGMDFAHFGMYDMWVLRDRIGHLPSTIWPFFMDETDIKAMQTASPVPVFACWNGVVAFQADPVLPVHLRSNRTLSNDPLRFPPVPTHPLANTTAQSPALTPPLSFRLSPRGEGCFSSESFLLPYDMRRIMGMNRIYVNPRVRVAYQWRFYVWHKWVLRHPYVAWLVERVYNGAWMQDARMIVGDGAIYSWDGGDCHPWWYGDWW